MKLKRKELQDKVQWERKNIALPLFDVEETAERTVLLPTWIHFGAGNIFRGFIADLQQRLLDAGEAKTGIIAAETYDGEIIRKIYEPYDNLSLLVLMRPDGTLKKTVIGSIARGLFADSTHPESWEVLQSMFRNPSLQMVSFTITEKGYSLRNLDG